MSLKSIGFNNKTGRGGRFNVPDIIVKNGNVFEIKKGITLPQVDIQNGLVEIEKTLNQISAQQARQQALYDADEDAYNNLIAQSPMADFNALVANIETLYANVSNQYTPQVTLSPTLSANYVRRGMGIRTEPYTLYAYTATKTTTYFVSVNLALSMQNNPTVTLFSDGITVSNAQANNFNGTYSQAYLQKNGVTIAQFYSCKRTYKGTNIFITGSTYVSLATNDILTVLFDFTNSFATSGLDTTSIAQCYGTNFVDTTNNMSGQILYNAPQGSLSGRAPQSSIALNKNQSPSVTIVQF